MGETECHPDGKPILASQKEPASREFLPSIHVIPSRLRLDDLFTDESLQTREKVDTEKVAEYADALKEGARFPPIVVFYDGERYWVADGFHRLEAVKNLGRSDIEAEVRSGDHAEALDYALSANARHGLPRTTADKQRAIRMAIKAHPDLGDNAIGELCAVDHKTVKAGRLRLGNFPNCERRVGRDGKVYRARKSRGQSPPSGPTAPSVADVEKDSIEPDEKLTGDGVTSDQASANVRERLGRAEPSATSTPNAEEDDMGSTPPFEQMGVNSDQGERTFDEVPKPVSPPIDATEHRAEEAHVPGGNTATEEPILTLLDGTPVLESQWQPGVVELQDVCNDFSSRRSRNADARLELQYSKAAVLLAERLTLAFGMTMNAMMPPRPSQEEANCFDEVVTFLRNRVRLAKESPIASNSLPSSAVEL